MANYENDAFVLLISRKKVNSGLQRYSHGHTTHNSRYFTFYIFNFQLLSKMLPNVTKMLPHNYKPLCQLQQKVTFLPLF